MKYIIPSLLSCLLLSACMNANTTGIQRGYVTMRDKCRASAEGQLAYVQATRGAGAPSDASGTLAQLFSDCMEGEGWLVASKKPRPNNAPPLDSIYDLPQTPGGRGPAAVTTSTQQQRQQPLPTPPLDSIQHLPQQYQDKILEQQQQGQVQQQGYSQPQYSQPHYQQPVYAQPQYSQPQYSQPQYQQPTYTQPHYSQYQPQQYQQQQPYPQQGYYAQPVYNAQQGYQQQPQYQAPQQYYYQQQPVYTQQQYAPQTAQPQQSVEPLQHSATSLHLSRGGNSSASTGAIGGGAGGARAK